MEVKVFKVVIQYYANNTNNTKPKIFYFTNRLELGYTRLKGASSVYEKLSCIRDIVNASNKKACNEAFSAQEKG